MRHGAGLGILAALVFDLAILQPAVRDHDAVGDADQFPVGEHGPGPLATVVESPDSPTDAVYVVLYEVAPEDEALLDAWEGAEQGLFQRITVRVQTLEGEVPAFVYVRLIVLMYFTEAPDDDEVVVVLTPSIGSTVAITAGVAATVVLGIVPSFLLEIASNASQFLL